ncbi:MAG TPA: TlpA disulfide reductase family protein [Candidatus Acidoferrum sp.]|nr:TlpA disulfide reductase family protein [Candidatus Acidoferrum sp.]
MTKRFVLLWVVLAGLAPLASAEELGDPAPPLVIKEWIKGNPVEIKPGTNIYVVAIWNTTSATTRNAIARLNEIQTKYKDKGVVVVAVSDETPEKIRKFMALPDVHMDYAVGADTARRTAISYMLGFKVRTVPQVFVIGKDGKFLWHGDPVRGLDQVLTKVLAGTYQVARAKDTDLYRRHLEEYLALSKRGDPRARLAGQSLMVDWTNDVSRLRDFAYVITIDTGNPHRDLTLAGQALDMAERISPTNTLSLFTARAAWVFECGRQDEAIGMMKDAIAAAKDAKEKAALEPYLHALEKRQAKLAAAAQAHSATNIVTITNVVTVTNTVTLTNAAKAETGPGTAPRP